MIKDIMYTNEFFRVYQDLGSVYIESFKNGSNPSELLALLASHPEIEITNFNVIKDALSCAPKPPEKFGKIKDKINITISKDGLKATVIINLPKENLLTVNHQDLIKEVYTKLSQQKIIFGIKTDILPKDIESGKSYVVAEGIAPVDGTDSIIKLYDFQEAKPQICEGDKANFYELKLIDRVKAGDWLGERIDATPGIPGQTVTGIILKPVSGKNYPFKYDKNTVTEISANGKTTLYSRINGAVSLIDDKISVSNHLEIDGDVDFTTGNIKFDGYISIKGTVCDGFSVEATKDIEINSELGLGNIKEIVSTTGSIFIKGGIASKGKSEIRAARDVYTKFSDNAAIHCGGALHIGFSCINSTAEAKQVIIDSPKGQILGGFIKAAVRVTTPTLGCEMEKRTVIEIIGFDKKNCMETISKLIHRLENLKEEQMHMKQVLSSSAFKDELTPYEQREYNKNCERLAAIKEEIKWSEREIKDLSDFLRTHGEGEVRIAKKAYPNCIITIRGVKMQLIQPVLSSILFVEDGELKQT